MLSLPQSIPPESRRILLSLPEHHSLIIVFFVFIIPIDFGALMEDRGVLASRSPFCICSDRPSCFADEVIFVLMENLLKQDFGSADYYLVFGVSLPDPSWNFGGNCAPSDPAVPPFPPPKGSSIPLMARGNSSCLCQLNLLSKRPFAVFPFLCGLEPFFPTCCFVLGSQLRRGAISLFFLFFCTSQPPFLG